MMVISLCILECRERGGWCEEQTEKMKKRLLLFCWILPSAVLYTLSCCVCLWTTFGCSSLHPFHLRLTHIYINIIREFGCSPVHINHIIQVAADVPPHRCPPELHFSAHRIWKSDGELFSDLHMLKLCEHCRNLSKKSIKRSTTNYRPVLATVVNWRSFYFLQISQNTIGHHPKNTIIPITAFIFLLPPNSLVVCPSKLACRAYMNWQTPDPSLIFLLISNPDW